MSQLTLIVRMKAKPGREAELERSLRAAIAPTHAEAGCLRFALHRATTDKAAFLLVERWSSKQALEQHLAQPYLKDLLAKLSELAEPADVGEYEMLTEGDARKAL